MNLRKSLTFCIVFIPILSVLSSCSLFLVATDDMSDKELQVCGGQAKIKANRKSCLDSFINRKSIKEPATKTDTDSYVMTNQGRHHFNIENNEIYIYYTDKDKAYGWIKKKIAHGFETSKFVLSCKSKNFLEEENKVFYSNGTVITTSELETNNLKTIEPGTISESLYDKICYAQ